MSKHKGQNLLIIHHNE